MHPFGNAAFSGQRFESRPILALAEDIELKLRKSRRDHCNGRDQKMEPLARNQPAYAYDSLTDLRQAKACSGFGRINRKKSAPGDSAADYAKVVRRNAELCHNTLQRN